jgi:hypothetical protein
MKSFAHSVLLLALFINLSGCGTLLHPERKGQTGGRIDPGVVILDGIGLLFFFIPGAIAFAVDFTYGTIYLPGGRRAALSDDELNQVTQNGHIDAKKLTGFIRQKVKSPIAFEPQDIQIMSLPSAEQLPKEFLISSS